MKKISVNLDVSDYDFSLRAIWKRLWPPITPALRTEAEEEIEYDRMIYRHSFFQTHPIRPVFVATAVTLLSILVIAPIIILMILACKTAVVGLIIFGAVSLVFGLIFVARQVYTVWRMLIWCLSVSDRFGIECVIISRLAKQLEADDRDPKELDGMTIDFEIALFDGLSCSCYLSSHDLPEPSIRLSEEFH